MRLLIDGSTLNKGGGVNVGRAVIESAAQDASVEAAVLTSLPLDHALGGEPPGVARYCAVDTSGPWGKLVRGPRALAALARTWQADVVYTIFGPAYGNLRHVLHVQGFARSLMLYPDLVRRWGPLPRRWLWQRRQVASMQWGVVETETLRQRLHAVLGVDLERISVVANGVSPAFERAVAMHETAELPALREAPVLLAPAAYYPHKNLEVLPSMLRALDRDGMVCTLRVTLDPRGFAQLRSVAERAGVAAQLVNVGELPVERLAEQYLACDAVVLPTLQEASTAVYPEAFRARRPLITSDRPFARELCGEAAIFADPDDPEALAAAVREGLRCRDRLVAAGLVQLEGHYLSPAAKWRRTREVLAEALARSQRVSRPCS